MKRFVMAAIISATMFAAAAALLASCTWMPVLEEEGDATLTFRFLQTKAGPVPDTGSFILRVCPAGADQPVYEGRYGERPATMKVPAGTYEVSAFSRRFPTRPATRGGCCSNRRRASSNTAMPSSGPPGCSRVKPGSAIWTERRKTCC